MIISIYYTANEMKILVNLSVELLEEHNLIPEPFKHHLIQLGKISRCSGSYNFHSTWLPQLYLAIRSWQIEHYKLYGEFSSTINEHKLIHLPLSILEFSATAI